MYPAFYKRFYHKMIFVTFSRPYAPVCAVCVKCGWESASAGVMFPFPLQHQCSNAATEAAVSTVQIFLHATAANLISIGIRVPINVCVCCGVYVKIAGSVFVRYAWNSTVSAIIFTFVQLQVSISAMLSILFVFKNKTHTQKISYRLS